MAGGWPKSAALLAVCLALLLCDGQAWASAKKTAEKGASLGVIVEKDLFRPSRQKAKPPKPKPKKPAEPVVVLPPPKSPPPRLTLSGTILLDSGDVALLSLKSSGGSGRYRIGDEIEGFRITEIGSESVTLKRDDEVLRVFMNSGHGGFYGQPGYQQAGSQNASAQSPPADIPPSLVPRPQSPVKSAPYRWNTRSR